MDDAQAFPNGGKYEYQRDGMSLRQYYAAKALPAIIEADGASYFHNSEVHARVAFAHADAMIAEGDKEKTNPFKTELEEANRRIASLEALRPHWAQGFSSDSIAAQSATGALSTLWAMLGVNNQTEAVARLAVLTKKED